jgi:hypothetical protein
MAWSLLYESLKGANMKRKSIIRGPSICVALIFVILTSGCVGPTVRTYSGDKLQKSEVAVIKGWIVVFPLEGLYISQIDGRPVDTTKLEVLPGVHTLVIRRFEIPFTIGLFSEGDRVLPKFEVGAEYNFEAGHQYKIKFLYKGILIDGVKIIDATTGDIIFTCRGYPGY